MDIPGSNKVDGTGPEHYDLAHLFIGAKLEVFGRQFVITGCDENVKTYLDESEVHLPDVCRDSIQHYFDTKQDFVEAPHVKVPVA